MIRYLQVGAVLGSLLLAPSIQAAVVTFEDLSLGNPGDGSTAYSGTGGGHYWNGSNLNGSFSTGGATFSNHYDEDFGSPYWDKFAYSNTTDNSTPGYGNQYSAQPGSGAGGSANYVVGYQPYAGEFALTFSTPQDFNGLSVDITNTTYAADYLLNGNGFQPNTKFGGTAGTRADWFLLTITGWNGITETGTVDFYLADYRFAGAGGSDYIITDWTSVDLSGLGSGVDKMTFALTSSDTSGGFINTPAYFAMDNLEVSSVPEPSTYALIALGLAALVMGRSLKKRSFRIRI